MHEVVDELKSWVWAPDAPGPDVYDSKCHGYRYSRYACSSETCIFCYQRKFLAFFPLLPLKANHQTKMKGPARRGLSLASIYGGLFRNYVCRAGSFFTLAHRVLNLLSFVEVGIPGCLDFRVVNKQVGSTIVSDDKPVSFFPIEPFDCSCTHNNTPWPFNRPSIYNMPLTFAVGGYP